MLADPRGGPAAVDVFGPPRHSITSLYSNLVTRPTGRAIRLGVESQLAELEQVTPAPCVSVLDFSQVRLLDYSCADEVVAKLLVRYQGRRATEVYFVARGLQEHHREAVETVLHRHGLLLVAEHAGGYVLLGAVGALGRCWEGLLRLRRAGVAEVAAAAGVHPASARDAMLAFVACRVALRHADDTLTALPVMLS
ncbi:hypothetical protein BH20GEM2_BH20GEM2_18850 [soil metagenome]